MALSAPTRQQWPQNSYVYCVDLLSEASSGLQHLLSGGERWSGSLILMRETHRSGPRGMHFKKKDKIINIKLDIKEHLFRIRKEVTTIPGDLAPILQLSLSQKWFHSNASPRRVQLHFCLCYWTSRSQLDRSAAPGSSRPPWTPSWSCICLPVSGPLRLLLLQVHWQPPSILWVTGTKPHCSDFIHWPKMAIF